MNPPDLADADKADRGNPFYAPVYFFPNQAIGGDVRRRSVIDKIPRRFEVDWGVFISASCSLDRSITVCYQ